MHFVYKTRGVCSRKIEYDVVDGKIHNINYQDGCEGNLKTVARLLEGMNIDDVIAKLKGIRCEKKNTSCADQLANALITQVKTQ